MGGVVSGEAWTVMLNGTPFTVTAGAANDTLDEIAQALEVQVGTVKSRIARARLRLQEALGDLVGGGWP